MAIDTLQALLRRGRTAEWPRLLALREAVLVGYLRILEGFNLNGSGPGVTEEYRRDAVARAQALRDMEMGRGLYWERVIRIIEGLRVGLENQHNLPLLRLAVSSISQKVATDNFKGPEEKFSINLWNQYSNMAIKSMERLVRNVGDACWLQLLTLRKDFLKQNLKILMRAGYDVTEADIEGAVARVEALDHMEVQRWQPVLHLIRNLRVGPGNFQLLSSLLIAVENVERVLLSQ
jgi:hypothetical protein